MTDREKIRAEVERLRNNYKYLSSTEAKYRYEAYTELIDFIDSFPEEPIGRELDEAASDFADAHVFATRKICFKAGARWMANQGVTFKSKIIGRNTIEQIDMSALAEKGIYFKDDIILQIRKG